MEFDEESVGRERGESILRAQKARDLVQKQETVLHRIHQQIGSDSEPLERAASPSRCVGTPQTVKDMPQHLSSTFYQQAWFLAQELQHRARKRRDFQAARQRMASEERQRQAQRRQEALQAEQRFAERRQEIADEQKRKALRNQQRRSEQQKLIREPQREEERREWQDSRKAMTLASPRKPKYLMSRSLPSFRRLRSTSEVWKERYVGVQEHEQDMEQQALMKEMKDEERLLGGRSRIERINKEIMQRALERGRQWRARNDAAAERRANRESKSGEDMKEKLRAGVQRKADLEQRRADAMAEAGARKDQQISHAQAHALQLLKETEQAVLARASKRDQMVAERQSIKLADFAAKLEDGGSPYQALAREAKVRKQLLEEAFRRKAEQEIEQKERPKKPSVMEKQRSLKKSQTSESMKSSLSIPELPFVVDWDQVDAWEEEYRQMPPQKKVKHRRRSSAAGSVISMNDEDAEKAMLAELERRSAHWLKEIKLQKEKSKIFA